MVENESLLTLERLMEEFFNSQTNNSRKHDIELQLNSFKCSSDSWKLCLYFISHSSNQYVLMYSLSIIETVINHQWIYIDHSYKEQLRNILYNFLIEKGNQAPHFLREKHTKLLVDIAKIDWPHSYPTFMDNILELLKLESNQLIGLILLRTTSEEFMRIDSIETKERKEELLRLLQPYIPVIFQILTRILENLDKKPRHSATATPPPSPTYPHMSQGLPEQLTSATFRPDGKIFKREVLNTLQHLFTWVPISCINSQIVRCIFNFTNITSYAQEDDDMCVLAMSTINEILYRKCIPPGTQDFFIQLYHHCVELVRDLSSSSRYRIETLDPTFVEKLSELLTLLIEQHFWRLDVEPTISTIEFLSLLFQLTMQLPSVQCYTLCLGVWTAFLKQIKRQNVPKYSEAYLSLVGMILKKIQFSTNSEQLQQLNFFESSDDGDTEWNTFVKINNEVISLIAEFVPLETFNGVLVPWKQHYEAYSTIGNILPNINFSDNQERLCYILIDFSTLTQTLARLSTLFTDQDHSDAHSCDDLILCLFKKILESALITTDSKMYRQKLDEKLRYCLENVHCELLAALQTWLFWIVQKEKLDDECLRTLLDISLGPLMEGSNIGAKLSCSAARLLLTLTSHAFPPDLIVSQQVRNFIPMASTIQYLSQDANHLVNDAICNLLFRNWGELSQSDSNARQYLIESFFENLTRDFRQLCVNTEEGKIRDVTLQVFPALAQLIDFCKNLPNMSKKLLFIALKSTIEHALDLFPSYVRYPEVVLNILDFFISVLEVLQQHLGVDGTQHAVKVFLQVAVSEHMTSQSSLEKLLHVLKLVVESPGSSNTYKGLLPSIMDLCIQHLESAVLSDVENHPELLISLLNLYYSVLLHRWQYFYMSQVRAGFSPCVTACNTSVGNVNANNATGEGAQKPYELLKILQLFGQALLQQDINVFKLSLTALEDLNSKWNIYSKVIFRDYLLNNFLAVLLECLLEKTQALLSEDIQVAVYHMASVNFSTFFSCFLPQFLNKYEWLGPSCKEGLMSHFISNYDKDMPTFIQNLKIFVKKAQYFKMCNSSRT